MTWTEQEYRDAGMTRPNLRLAKSVMVALRQLAADSGESMSAVVSRLILAESEKSTRPKKKDRSKP